MTGKKFGTPRNEPRKIDAAGSSTSTWRNEGRTTNTSSMSEWAGAPDRIATTETIAITASRRCRPSELWISRTCCATTLDPRSEDRRTSDRPKAYRGRNSEERTILPNVRLSVSSERAIDREEAQRWRTSGWTQTISHESGNSGQPISTIRMARACSRFRVIISAITRTPLTCPKRGQTER